MAMATASETSMVAAAPRATRTGGRGGSTRASGTLAVLLLAPTALLLALIIVYPVCRLVWTSFHEPLAHVGLAGRVR